jgi:hypothetical protein
VALVRKANYTDRATTACRRGCTSRTQKENHKEFSTARNPKLNKEKQENKIIPEENLTPKNTEINNEKQATRCTKAY